MPLTVARPCVVTPFIVSLASVASLTAGESHLLNGTLENPEFVNSTVGTDLLWGAGFYGQGVVIANVEAGHVWSGHEVFDRTAINLALGLSLPASPVRLVNASPNETTPSLGEVDFHATMVGHVLVGARTVQTEAGLSLTAVGAGMAPFATLWSGAIATSYSTDPEEVGAFSLSAESFRTPYVEFFAGGAQGRADVINSSWGGSELGDSAEETRVITALAAENPMVTAVFSAGNTGAGVDTVAGPGISANVIAVGSLGGAAGLTPSEFSSGGPVAFYHPGTQMLVPEARAAVHIAAPGENYALAAYLQSTGGLTPLLTPEIETTANDLYFIFSASGTSFAAPIVAGGVALLKNVAKENPAVLPSETALDARVIRSVVMAGARRTEGWDNGQVVDGAGAAVTTRAVDYRTGAGAFDVARAAEILVNGVRDVPGTGGAAGLAEEGWDFGSVTLGAFNDYGIDAAALAAAGPGELAVSLNWQVSEHFDSVSGLTEFGSFADLNLEVWSAGAGGGAGTLLAASRTAFNTMEFLRISVTDTAGLWLRVRFDELVYNFDGAAGLAASYGLAWGMTATAIPEPAAWAGLAGLGALGLAGARRRRRA